MQDSKGHHAKRPKQIPKKGWKAILTRVKDQIKIDNIELVSAGVAFYFFLALFPTLAAAISIYGLVADPSQLEQQMSEFAAVLPEEAHTMLEESLSKIVEGSGEALGWGLALSILLSLWSANKGTKALFTGVNIAYDEENKRSFFKENGLTLLFTLGGILLGIVCGALIVVFPAFVDKLNLPGALETVIAWARWPFLGVVVTFALALIYKFAPDRDNPQFKWVSWGAGVAAVLWIIGSLGFSFYVSNFGSYNETYGSLAAVIILLLWFMLTGFIVLLGAEINSEMEHQTSQDTTIGKERPLGERGAFHADHVAGKHQDKNY